MRARRKELQQQKHNQRVPRLLTHAHEYGSCAAAHAAARSLAHMPRKHIPVHKVLAVQELHQAKHKCCVVVIQRAIIALLIVFVFLSGAPRVSLHGIQRCSRCMLYCTMTKRMSRKDLVTQLSPQ